MFFVIIKFSNCPCFPIQTVEITIEIFFVCLHECLDSCNNVAIHGLKRLEKNVKFLPDSNYYGEKLYPTSSTTHAPFIDRVTHKLVIIRATTPISITIVGHDLQMGIILITSIII